MPTLKQKELVKRITENKGKRPVTELMVESGYSPSVARGMQKRIQQGIGFVEILNQAGLTDKFIAKRLREGVNAKNGKKPDLMMRHRYVETAMKAKHLLNEDNSNPISGLSDFIETLKGFNLDVLVAIKARLKGDNVPAAT